MRTHTVLTLGGNRLFREDRQTMTVKKDRPGHSKFRNFLIHHPDKGFLRTGDGLRQTQHTLVAGGQKSPHQQIFHRNLLSRFQGNHSVIGGCQKLCCLRDCYLILKGNLS